MDSWRVEPFIDRLNDPRLDLPAEIARFGAAGLSLRLTALQQKLERDFPLTVALDIADRDAVDGLAPDLTAAVHAMLQEAARNAARHSGGSLIRMAVQASQGAITLRIEDDGAGFAFKGIYELNELLAFGVGPRVLAQRVAACGGELRLDSRASGSRIEITVPRSSRIPVAEPASAPALAIAS